MVGWERMGERVSVWGEGVVGIEGVPAFAGTRGVGNNGGWQESLGGFGGEVSRVRCVGFGMVCG